MNTKLSKREKTMLYLLLCFLILTAGLMGFILPAIAAQNVLEEEYNQAQTRYALMAGTSKEAETLMQRSEELDRQISAAMENFYPALEAEGIDRAATAVFLKNGVTPLSFTMTPPKLNEVKPYFFTDKFTYGSALTSDVTFIFYASAAQFSRIMQHIQEAPWFQVISFTYVPYEVGQAQHTQTPDADETPDMQDPQTGDNQYILTLRLLMQREYAGI